jgi:hypothetical protein
MYPLFQHDQFVVTAMYQNIRIRYGRFDITSKKILKFCMSNGDIQYK